MIPDGFSTRAHLGDPLYDFVQVPPQSVLERMEKQIANLIQRVEDLERPWYQRLWSWLCRN